MLRKLRSTSLVVATLFFTAMLIGCHSGGGRLASRSGCSSGHCSAPAVASAPKSDFGSTESPNAPAIASKSQRTCPVTGEELGSMGKPIPVTVKGETILVCCQGCVKKVQANPDKYLAKVHAETRS